MKTLMKRAVAGVGALTLAGGLVVASSSAAHAAGNPTYEPDANQVGNVTLYNSSGTAITSGNLTDSPIAAYFKASGNGAVPLDANAQMAFSTPQDGIAPASWTTTELWSSSQAFGTAANPGYPVGLAGVPNAVVKGAVTDGSLQTHISNFPSASVNNPGVYQIRIYTSGSSLGSGANYYSADILVSGSTWTLIPQTASSVSVTTSPASPTARYTSVGITATWTGGGSTGNVLFYDNATQIGTTTAVTGVSGSTTFNDAALTVGAHNLWAIYQATGSGNSGIAGSNSAVAPYTITAVPTSSALAIVATPPGSALTNPANVVSAVSLALNATVTDTTAGATTPNIPGTVKFWDGSIGGTQLGTTQTLVSTGGPGPSTGTASVTVITGNGAGQLHVGTHNILMQFIPANLNFGASQTTAFVVNVGITPTTTAAANTDTAPIQALAPLHFTATVGPTGVAGSVTWVATPTTPAGPSITLGTTAGTSPNFALTSAGLAVNTYNVVATFTPTDTATYGVSSNAAAPVSIQVVAATCPGVVGASVCTDTQYIQAEVTPGNIVISTPYNSATSAFDIGNLVLSGNQDVLTATATFPKLADPAISIVSTLAGNQDWAAKVQSTTLAGATPIPPQYVGFAQLNDAFPPGNALAAPGRVSLFNNYAYSPSLIANVSGPGYTGLSANPVFTSTSGGGTGTVYIRGQLTIGAPTSTLPGTYAGTLIFTVG